MPEARSEATQMVEAKATTDALARPQEKAMLGASFGQGCPDEPHPRV